MHATAGAGAAILAAVAMLVPQSVPWTDCCRPGVPVCDALMGHAPALFEREVQVSGSEAFHYQLSAPPDQPLLLLAGEHGVDVLLTASHGAIVERSDSPLPGFGVQRLQVPAGSRDWQVQVSAKDQDALPGMVTMRAVPIPAAARQECTSLQSALARADAAQGLAWAIGNGLQAARAGEAESSQQTSIETYLDVLERPSIPAPLRAALTLAVARIHYRSRSDWESAAKWAARAAAQYRRIPDTYGFAQSQLLRGMVLIESDPAAVPDSLVRAQSLLREVARVHQARGELREQAHALNNLGIAQYYSALYTKARDSYQAAATLYRQTGDRARAWQVADNLGLIDYELGRLEDAALTYRALLAEPGLHARPPLYLNVLTNGALVQLEKGEAGEALRAYQEALALARDLQHPFYEALSLQGIGGAYEALGDPEMALTHYQGALRLRTRESGVRARLETLWSLGDVERRMGRSESALALDREAMALAGSELDRARIRLRLAADHEALGDTRRSLAELDPLLSRRVPGDDYIHARAQLQRGRLLAASQSREAARDLRSALEAFERFDAAAGQFDAHIALASLDRARGDRASAIREVDAAIALAERLRLQSANPGLRASLLETLRPAFDLKIAMLADASAAASTAGERQSFAWQALEVAESARARAMQDYAAMASSADAGASPLLAQRRDLYVELAQAQARLDRMSLDLRTGDRLLQTIREDLATSRRQIDQLESQLAASGESSDTYTAPSLRTARIALHIAVVEYWIGATRAFSWVVDAAGLQMVDLGPSAPINAAAGAAQAALRDVQAGDPATRLDALQTLSDLIWKPLSRLMPADATVVFVPDMTLHYIPFAALSDGARGDFLITHRDVATAASLRQLLEMPRTHAPTAQRMLIVADPEYGSAAARLPATAREADAIERLAAGTWQVDRLQGPDATRARFLDAPLGDYQYIHIATHALANARIPQLSALRLAGSDDGAGDVLAADLLGVKLQAELVVLSACDTALGRVVSGEGVIGLRYVLLARGAQAVVSSLWKVGDRPAQEFMTAFYAALFSGHANTAAAMSTAMRSVMARHGPDPAMWAGFDLSVRSLQGRAGPDA